MSHLLEQLIQELTDLRRRVAALERQDTAIRRLADNTLQVANTLTLTGGLNIGTATNAPAGDIRASGGYQGKFRSVAGAEASEWLAEISTASTSYVDVSAMTLTLIPAVTATHIVAYGINVFGRATAWAGQVAMFCNGVQINSGGYVEMDHTFNDSSSSTGLGLLDLVGGNQYVFRTRYRSLADGVTVYLSQRHAFWVLAIPV